MKTLGTYSGSKQQLGSKEEMMRMQTMMAQNGSDMQTSGGLLPHPNQPLAHDYYSQKQLKKSSNKISPDEAVTQGVRTQQIVTRNKSKQGAPNSNYMIRRSSDDKQLEVKAKPTIGTQRNQIYFHEYLESSKARSPKIYASKQLEHM